MLSVSRGLRVGLREKAVRSLAQASFIQRKHINIASLLCNHGRSVRKEFAIDFYGYKYVGSINNITDWYVYFADKFIAAEMAFLQSVGSMVKRQGKPFVCYDLGANLGHMTLGMASCADKVLAVEPFSPAFSELSDKISTNRIRHVKAFQVGLDEEGGKATFDVLSMINLAVKRTKSNSRMVPLGSFDAVMVRGDDFIKRNRLDPPNFIRINAGDDCLSVLLGLSATIRRFLPIILISLPLNTPSRMITEEALRTVLYEDAHLFSFQRANGEKSFFLDQFTPFTQNVVCIPPDTMRVAAQDFCKLRGARMHGF